MEKPQNYEQAEAKINDGTFEQPPAGGHVFKIVDAETKTSAKGNEMLVLSLDITEGEFAGHYTKLSDKYAKPKYLRVFQLTGEEHTSYFKGVIKAIEESNVGFIFDFDEKKLIGKKVGGNLREEEFLPDGETEVKVALKIGFLCSVQSVREGLPIMKRKTLSVTKNAPSTTAPSSSAPKDDDLPF